MLSKVVLLALVLGVASASSLYKKVVTSRATVPEGEAGLGIYDGSKTTIQKHPYMAALLQGGAFWCAGAIVSKSWLITIGDCTYGASPSDIQVVVGSNDGTTGTKYTVKTIVPHPSYGTNQFDYDIAAIQIKGNFKFSSKVKAVKVPTKAAKAKTQMVVSGYGSTDSSEVDGPANNQLLQGNMNWLDKKTCASTYSGFGFTWTARMGCTYNKGKTTCCTGDWSDPFVYKNAVYGLLVAGASDGWCTGSALPVIVTDVQSVAAWVKKTTGAKSEDDDELDNEEEDENEEEFENEEPL